MAKKRDPALLRQLGARFRAIRLAAGKTQEQVAEGLGVQPVTISRWETGKVGLSLPVLNEAAAFFGVALSEVFAVDQPLPELTAGEQELVAAWTKLDPEQRKLVVSLLGQLAGGQDG